MPTTYRAGLYLRLSKEDVRKAGDSIETQRQILHAFCQENGFLIAEEYVDDGYSGTTVENRPAFLRLMRDIDAGKINLVLTKDLSRLGRNIGETTLLLDKIFPEKKVRYISATEGADTACRDRTYQLLTPIRNFTNELYAADLSNKIHAALDSKIRRGAFIGSFAPFGYQKDARQRNHLTVDEPAAAIVREIFRLAAGGQTPAQIASYLNTKQIPTPLEYRRHTNAQQRWQASGVTKLLRNEVYLGHTVQGKTIKPSFKSKAVYSNPKCNWIKVEHTHTPLITADIWNTVRNRMRSRAKSESRGFTNLFSGIAKCADCGRNMSTSGKQPVRLVCGGYKLNGKTACSNHAIAYDDLCRLVLPYLNTEALSRALLFSRIARINVHQAERQNGSKKQKIDVFLKPSGAYSFPAWETLLRGR